MLTLEDDWAAVISQQRVTGGPMNNSVSTSELRLLWLQ